ncbi:MAG: F0F1 ATP synthase subunit gamma [Alphaproteobacteria bacterium]|nr:F0F1 ATP synthase subunit gamma [Alphaproteobacteria bacterium]
MPSLKDLRLRIRSVRSTQKITAAMKMVAGAKLRRAQEAAEAARPYADRMDRMLRSLASSFADRPGAPPILAGTGKSDVHLLIVATADRGLCGSFNASIVRDARNLVRQLTAEGKTVKILTIGRKARDLLRRQFGSMIVESFVEMDKPRLSYAAAERVAAKVTAMLEAGEFDVCTIIYNRFKSALSQIVTRHQLIPFKADAPAADAAPGGPRAIYEYEPDEEEILAALLPKNMGIQIFRALLENYASEQGARMTAMENATRNAGDMIGKLTMRYNRTRQAQITKELIEIISGAEAV